MSLLPPVTSVIPTSTNEQIFVGEWPGSSDLLPVLFAPGLTSTHRAIAGVADVVDGAFRTVALDLRGRGNSTKPASGNYGMAQHARDILEVADACGIDRFVMSGHSMGGYVASAVFEAAPERVAGVILIDGGVIPPFLRNTGVDPDVLLEMTLGPSMARFSMTWPSVDAYVEEQLASEYFAGMRAPVNELYLQYNIEPKEGSYRLKCLREAAVEDWRDVLTPEGSGRADRISVPVLALAAEFGLSRDGARLLGEPQREHIESVVKDLTWLDVAGTGHHTVLLSDIGAKVCADAVLAFVKRVSA